MSKTVIKRKLKCFRLYNKAIQIKHKTVSKYERKYRKITQKVITWSDKKNQRQPTFTTRAL